jgi:lauroyl/myristoyl acyltransferase
MSANPETMKWQLASKGRAAGFLFSTLMRFLPRRLRFRATMAIARIATPFLQTTAILRQRVLMRMESPREIIVYHLLEILTRNGVLFDPVVRTYGWEHVTEALASGRGVLIVAPHAMLSTFILWLLRDTGAEMNVVSPAKMLVLGTGAPVRLIHPTPAFLLQVRKVLREPGVVGAMIDRDVITTRSTFQVATDRGPVVIADALIHVAFRMKAQIVFHAGYLDGDEVVVTFDVPSADESRSAEGITAALVAFVQKHVARLHS